MKHPSSAGQRLANSSWTPERCAFSLLTHRLQINRQLAESLVRFPKLGLRSTPMAALLHFPPRNGAMNGGSEARKARLQNISVGALSTFYATSRHCARTKMKAFRAFVRASSRAACHRSREANNPKNELGWISIQFLR